MSLILFAIAIYRSVKSYRLQQHSLIKSSIDDLKEKISDDLKKIKNKLIIVIDDIDRLTKTEIRQLFQLIKANADFPNVIYLLAFDREIVEHNLPEQDGFSGRDYLEKIVQVFFDIPYVIPAKIHDFLYEKLSAIIDKQSDCQDLFDSDYWRKIFDYSFKYLFKTLRDVTRFINSLKFNISMLHTDEVLEVNPDDFIAIEAIRLFIPSLYDFIKNNKALFIDDIELIEVNDLTETRKKLLDEELNKLPDDIKENIFNLIKVLFPKIKYFFSDESYKIEDIYTHQQRICSKHFFNCYFSFYPGGDEYGISQYDLEKVFNTMQSIEGFTEVIHEYKDNSKITQLLELIRDNVNYSEKILNNVKNIIQVLVNFTDDLNPTVDSDFQLSIAYETLLKKLLARQNGINQNYNILTSIIKNTDSIYGAVFVVYTLEKKNNITPENICTPEEVIKLKNQCIEKSKNHEKHKLLENKKLSYLLDKWQDSKIKKECHDL